MDSSRRNNCSTCITCYQNMGISFIKTKLNKKQEATLKQWNASKRNIAQPFDNHESRTERLEKEYNWIILQ